MVSATASCEQVNCVACTVQIKKYSVRCPVCRTRQPRTITRPIHFHILSEKNDKNQKCQNDDGNSDDDLPEMVQLSESDTDSDSDDTDSDSDEDDEEIHDIASGVAGSCENFTNDYQQKLIAKMQVVFRSQLREALGQFIDESNAHKRGGAPNVSKKKKKARTEEEVVVRACLTI